MAETSEGDKNSKDNKSNQQDTAHLKWSPNNPLRKKVEAEQKAAQEAAQKAGQDAKQWNYTNPYKTKVQKIENKKEIKTLVRKVSSDLLKGLTGAREIFNKNKTSSHELSYHSDPNKENKLIKLITKKPSASQLR